MQGAWPTVRDVGRAAMRQGEDTDVFDALRVIPAPLGRVTHEDEIILRARGLALSNDAAPVLTDYVRVLELAAKRFLGEDLDPKLLSTDLTEALGMSEHRARLVGDLVLSEDWMFSGGSGGPRHADGWMRNIDERLRYVRNVHSLDDYLRAEAENLWPEAIGAPVVEIPERYVSVSQAGRRKESSPHVFVGDLFEPAIAERATKLLADGHYDEAVRAGALALRDVLRTATGLTLDGHSLVGAAFGGQDPVLRLADTSIQTGRREQEGWHKLADGCFAALRNAVAHREVRFTYAEAAQALALMSLLAGRAKAAGNAREDTPIEREPVIAP